MKKFRKVSLSEELLEAILITKLKAEDSWDATIRRAYKVHPNDLTIKRHLASIRPVEPRVRKYPLRQLEVGQSVILPWRPGEMGDNQKPLLAAVYYEMKYTGRKLHWQAVVDGLQVTRLE